MKQKYILKGLIKSIPGIEYIINFHKHTGGDTENARYCYSIWMRHLVLAFENGCKNIPEVVAELGPGHSLGLGIAALLSGTKKYYGLDAVRYSDATVNLKILDSLAELFASKAPIPDNREFPLVEPQLHDYSFPGHIIPESAIDQIKHGNIMQSIKRAIEDVDEGRENTSIVYAAPWFDLQIEKDSVDMIVSQTVLQHADNVESAYQKMHDWLKPNGIISHTIDFGCMKSADEWNGHWTYSDLEWKILRGRKKFYINRFPLSKHLSFLQQNGFEIKYLHKKKVSNNLSKSELATSFKDLQKEDLETSVAFFQAIKSNNKSLNSSVSPHNKPSSL